MGQPAIPINLTSAELTGLTILSEPLKDGLEAEAALVLADGRRITTEDPPPSPLPGHGMSDSFHSSPPAAQKIPLTP